MVGAPMETELVKQGTLNTGQHNKDVQKDRQWYTK